MISINHADNASIRNGIVPKRGGLEMVVSNGIPVNAAMQGIDVQIATSKTKIKVATDFKVVGKKGIKIIPALAMAKDEIMNCELFILFYRQ